MDAALPEAEREVVVAAEPCGHGSKFEDIYRLLAEGCFPPSFCSIKRKNLKRYARKFVVDGGSRAGRCGAALGRGLPRGQLWGEPAPQSRGMCRSLGVGRGAWYLPLVRDRGCPGWHRSSADAPWGSRRFCCGGGFRTVLGAGKLRGRAWG